MHALTHLPSPHLQHGQRTHIAREALDPARALEQHRAYCQMLRACGVDVHLLDCNGPLPDATFIEDTAVVLDEVAVLTSMGTADRRAELAGIAAVLQSYRPMERIELPATLEGGDVLRIGRTLLVGLSCRTNQAGVQALGRIVARYGYRVVPVPVSRCLHLKTACTALPDDRLLVNPAWLETAALSAYETLPVPPEEPWAANTLRIGQRICLAQEHPQTAALLRRRGFEVHTVPLSEFAKAEGGVTCLALLFA